MFFSIRVLVLMLFWAFGLQVMAQERASTSQEESKSMIEKAVQDTAILEGLITPVNDSRWVFLGCLESSHDCDHTAHAYGYHHHFVRADHYVCHDHHHPYACYGRN